MTFLEHLVDKEYILSRVTQEEIFERYLELAIREDVKYANPLRIDRNPTCNYFYTDSGKLIFKDWGGKVYDCFEVVKDKYGITFQESLQLIAADFSIGTQVNFAEKKPGDFKKLHTRKENGDYTPIQIKRKKWSDRELQFWQLPDREVTMDELERGRIFSISHYWFNGRLSGENLTGAFAYHLGYLNKFQIYRPFVKNKHYKFRQSSSSWVIGLTDLNPDDDYVICTKSYKDLFYLKLAGFNAVCVLSESKLFTEDELKQLTKDNRKLLLLYDNDKAGIKMSEERSQLYDCSYILYPTEWGKDTYDVAKKYGIKKVQEYLWESLDPLL